MQKAIFTIGCLFCCLFLFGGCKSYKTTDLKFQEYKDVIYNKYGYDIGRYKEQLIGGRADNRDITKYDLDQLLLGMKVESEHTNDKAKALEITMDHLEEIPDYYTRLLKLEKEYEKETRE